MRRFLFLAACLSIASGVLGQQSAPEGELKDAEFIIEKERKLLPPEASRLFESAPVVSFTTVPRQPLAYAMLDLFPAFEALSFKTPMLRAKRDSVARCYNNHLQVGHGNFYRPFLEGSFTNKDHAKYIYGLQLRHLSSGKEAYAEETHNRIRLHGKLFTRALCLGGEMTYNRDKYPLYKPDQNLTAASSSQTLHHVVVRNTVASYVYGPLNYQVDAAFHYLCDAYQARENQWEFSARGDYILNDGLKLEAFTNLYLTKYTDTTTNQRNLWRTKSMLSWAYHGWDVQGGMNLVYQNAVTHASHAFNVYPVLEVSYALCSWLRPYLGICGDLQRNSLRDLLQENPLLASRVDLRHTNQRFEFHGGAKGNILTQVSWHAGLVVGLYKDFHCLVNSDQDLRRFDVQYDPSTTLLNTFLELTHTNQAATLSTQLRGDFFHYTLKELHKPWHRPRYQLDLRSTYRLHDKLGLSGSLGWIGGVEAWDVTQKMPVALEDVFDVGLGIDYWLGSRLSFFLNCKNLLARRNVRYLHYPSQGFHCMAGLTYAW